MITDISPTRIAEETEKLFTLISDSSESPAEACAWRDAFCHECADVVGSNGQESELMSAQQFAEYLAVRGWRARGLNFYCGDCD